MALSKLPYKGTRDFFPADMRKRNYIFEKLTEVSEIFAYEPYDGPILEEVDLYRAKSGDELINDQIYNFVDRGEREVAIRPEMTPTLARMVSQIHREVSKPLRWYAIPNLMRYEKQQRGRLREFWQYNADIFGAQPGLGEVEIIDLAVQIMKSFGANETHFEILFNDRRLVDIVFNEKLKCSSEQSHKLYKLVDRAKKIPEEKLLVEAKNILNDSLKVEQFIQYLKSTNYAEALNSIEYNKEDFNYLSKIENLGLSKYLKFDPTIVRGLDYYTGLVFEIYDLHPDNKRAIAGGGAYANLLQIFNEPALAGIGFGLGEVTLTDFLESHKLIHDFNQTNTTLLIAYLDLNSERTALKLAQNLRSRGIQTEIMLGESKPKKIFSHTEKKGHHFVLIIGENEMNSGVMQIKNLKKQETHNIALADLDAMIKIFEGSISHGTNK